MNAVWVIALIFCLSRIESQTFRHKPRRDKKTTGGAFPLTTPSVRLTGHENPPVKSFGEKFS
jgi:hypothetical protein